MRGDIERVAREYFTYMAGSFPVMCSHDEFHLLPRAEEALSYLGRLDSLDRDKIKQALNVVARLLNRVEKLSDKHIELDDQIDIALLEKSMKGFLKEYGRNKIWSKDPNIYVKIYLFSVDQIFSRIRPVTPATLKALISRIKKGKLLFKEAGENLKKIPKLYKDTAVEIINSSISFFNKDIAPFLEKRISESESGRLIKEAVSTLEDFKKYLKRKPAHEKLIKDKELLEDLLKTNYFYGMGLQEIFDTAKIEYDKTVIKMAKTAKSIKSAKDWQEILSGYNLNVKTRAELIKAYSDQIQKLKTFLIRKNVVTITGAPQIKVATTPRYLMPIRQTASYCSPVSRSRRERATFYVTVHSDKDETSLQKGLSNIHNEYIFVTAHETFPGHHLLDAKRREIKNSVRRNIESPLFYEGWASYAETLIDRLGFVKDPRQKLVGLKRQAWRAVRAMLDAGLRVNKFTLEDASAMLRRLGYHSKIVNPMVKHYALTYGYQLCYTIGKVEFEKLHHKFVPKLGMKKFHDTILSNGEIPFFLLDRKLERAA